MRWTAIFFALVYGQPAQIDDLDGPQEFRHYLACVSHAKGAAPKLQSIMRGHTKQEVVVKWKCWRKR